ncbi:YdbH domain-containing protein [Pelagicoccus sp. SDUM812002]|uniref:intermembrane phospholipid transport protein YdbH family protein n=1 Tax=Pelagicoccus sp. SDUM812002 TaxID=3041266 RepID=UPI00280F0D31|nr:YdbH domain-containing protein [Pelagicoccus sp. SDUM812002]MDQ8186676.1 YdbH domain-containing protein [Pelagicoccus sp. SDUM812002]
MNPRFRKPIRILLRTIVVLTTLLLIGVVCLWGLRTRLLTSLAKDYLEELGIEDPQLTVTDLQTNSLSVGKLKIAFDGSELAANNIVVSFSLSELLKSNRIQEARIDGATFTLQLPEQSAGATGEQAEPPTLAELAKLLDLSSFYPLPFQSIQISDSSLTLKQGDISIPLSLEANATATSPQSLDFHALLAQAENSLQLQAKLASPTLTQASVSLELENPISLLDQYLPSWKDEVPELTTINSGPLSLQALLKQQESADPTLDLSFEISELDFEYDEIFGTLPLLTATTYFTDFTRIPILLEFSPNRLIRDTLDVTPRQEIALDVNIKDLSVVEIQTRFPIVWTYDSDLVSAHSDIELSYQLDVDEDPLRALISNTKFTVSDFELAPFTISASGSTSKINFQTSLLELSTSTPAFIHGGRGNVLIPEATDEAISVSFAGKLHPEPLVIKESRAIMPSSDLNVETQVFDTHTDIQLTLAAIPSSPLLSIPDVATLQGVLNLSVNLQTQSDSDTLSGNAIFDASNISIQSKFVSGTGISLQTKLDFLDLDSTRLSLIDLSDEQALTEILLQVAAQVDWQASQLTTPDFNAQWSGGSFSLNPENNQLLLSSYVGAGILELDQIRLDQVYIENEHRGTLTQLTGRSQASTMLDGINLQIDSQHRINAPLTNLSLSGEYTLVPVSIVHSDLPGRFKPELAGLSVSADIHANGTFRASSENADGSLSLKVRKGTISYPASQVKAGGLTIDIELASIAKVDSGDASSSIHIEDIEAGDLRSIQADSQFRIHRGETLSIDSANVSLFGGQAKLGSTQIPLNGSDFKGSLELHSFDLAQIASYIDIFDGQMQGKVSGYLPFRLRSGNFELLRGDLRLPDGTLASLKYNTTGLLTDNSPKPEKSSLSDRLLKFLKVNPDLAAEQALGDITITTFETELFPEDDPKTPIRIRLEGVAHSGVGDIPVVIDTQVRGSLSELYNFLIRLNSL